ncbi:hypothetical protein M8C21_004048 [Ambrosia artemisiifolia]|uniref:Uncharacterized protein n=1 Tax=Ambrosia artemisiifolia TaxID=4212 RepID=A0AAD5GEJ0_AMBAR|nr:hypothetical protein M8C21_004048 [Ambrosia artemisiifolia]
MEESAVDSGWKNQPSTPRPYDPTGSSSNESSGSGSESVSWAGSGSVSGSWRINYELKSSVVVQELRVEVDCVHPVLCLSSIKSGSYKLKQGCAHDLLLEAERTEDVVGSSELAEASEVTALLCVAFRGSFHRVLKLKRIIWLRADVDEGLINCQL